MAERTYCEEDLEVEKTYLMRLFQLHEVGREVCIPAIVEEYNRKTHYGKVKPIVNHLQYDNGQTTSFERPVVQVRFLQFAHGGYIIDAPVFKGDTGYLIAGDRNAVSAINENDTLLYEAQENNDDDSDNKGAQDPDNADLGKFIFGFFIPCSWANTGLTDDDGLVLHHAKSGEKDRGGAPTNESDVREIKINDDGITITHKGDASDDKEATITITDDAVTVKRVGDQEDTVKISDDGIEYDGTPDRTQQFVTDVQYDISSHCVQKKTVDCDVRGDFIVGIGEESDWTTITGGQAVPEQTSDS